MMRFFMGIATLSLVIAAPAFGATYTRLIVQAGAGGTDIVQHNSSVMKFTDGEFYDDPDYDPAIGVSWTAGDLATDGATATARGLIDTATGEIKTFGSYDQTRADAAGQTYAAAEGLVNESFILNGSGTFEVLMAVDVDWAFDVGEFSAAVNLFLSDGSIYDDLTFGPGTGSIDDHLLGVSIDFTDAVDLMIGASWFVSANAQIGAGLTGAGLIDASSTSTLFYRTTGTLFATPENPDFLSREVFTADIAPAVVPLPATAGLSGLALAALAAAGCRRRR